MEKLKTLLNIFRTLWSQRGRDQTKADVMHSTEAIMGDLGYGVRTPPSLDDEAINALMEPEWDDLYPDDFVLTQPQLDLIRNARMGWNTTEMGAPMLDLYRPYFGGPTARQVELALGEDALDMEKAAFLISMVSAFSTFFSNAKIEPGPYKLTNLDAEDIAAAAMHDQERLAWFGLNEDGTVALTQELIQLVRNLQWDWADEDDIAEVLYKGELPSPIVDPKRPYGDMSYFQLDIHRILEWRTEQKTSEGYIALTDAQELAASDLHFRTMLAAQAMIEHATIDLKAAE